MTTMPDNILDILDKAKFPRVRQMPDKLINVVTAIMRGPFRVRFRGSVLRSALWASLHPVFHVEHLGLF